jgi:uncharacterized protein (TIGR02246 family)
MRLAVLLFVTTFVPLTWADATIEACRQLVMDYAWYRDHPDTDAYAALFTDDAELSILGETFKGREAIAQRLTASAGSTVHLMSTIRVTKVDEDTATGVSYVTVYTAPPGIGPHTVSGYAAIGEYHDDFRKTETGWQIKKRVLVLRLRDSNFKPPPAN